MKPSAQIRGFSHGKPPGLDMTKQVSNSKLKPPAGTPVSKSQDTSRHLFTSSRNILPRPFPTISMMMRPPKPAGTMTHYRHFSGSEMLRSNCAPVWMEGGLRKDIVQWMLQNWLWRLCCLIIRKGCLWDHQVLFLGGANFWTELWKRWFWFLSLIKGHIY